MPTSAPTTTPQLGLWDAVNVIIGIVIGAGLYETAPLVLANVTSPAAAVGVWAFGGLLSLIGALCYAELATTYPRSGGDYAYLSRAFGPFAGFLFGWAQLAILLTGSIGMMAYVFADYAAVLFGAPLATTPIFAAAAVLALTLLNVRGALASRTAQNVLTGLKVVGLMAVTLVGFLWSPDPAATPAAAPAAGPAAASASLGLAMILVLYTYGGWNDAAFIAAEVKNNRRNIPKALLLGTGAVALIYLVVNLAFINALGFQGAQGSRAIAADVLAGPLGPLGAKAMSLLVMVSALGAINGLILTGSRVYATLGEDYSVVASLGQRNARGAPLRSLWVQAAVTLLLILGLGTGSGRGAIDSVLLASGLSAADWSGHGGFDTLLRCTAPVFWAFFLMTGVSVFVLRRKDADLERPFRVPLYPFVPLIFVATCIYMLHAALLYAGKLSLIGALPLLLGVPLFFASKRRPNTDTLPLFASGSPK